MGVAMHEIWVPIPPGYKHSLHTKKKKNMDMYTSIHRLNTITKSRELWLSNKPYYVYLTFNYFTFIALYSSLEIFLSLTVLYLFLSYYLVLFF